MNHTDRPRYRPRNRQPRPQQTSTRGGKPPSSSRPRNAAQASTPAQRASPPPPSRLIVPGAPVFIVQKQDQPSGLETRGVVRDVLTRGEHPRGVKVRLRDGRVGRVRRMDAETGFLSGEEVGESAEVAAASSSSSSSSRGGNVKGGYGARDRYSDVRHDGHLDGPPQRTLADYMTHLDGLP